MFGKSFVLLEAHTNNEAEYQALFTRQHMCLEIGVRRLIVKGDFLLVIKQLVGVWKVKKDALKECTMELSSWAISLRLFDSSMWVTRRTRKQMHGPL